MSEPATPETPAELYQRLMRERYGDPAVLRAELTGHVPAPPKAETGRPAVNVTPPITAPVRAPTGSGRYAEDHARILRWIKRSHPDWTQYLAVLGEGGVAHVLTSQGPTIAYSLCGKRGEATPAGDTIPVCRVCSA